MHSLKILYPYLRITALINNLNFYRSHKNNIMNFNLMHTQISKIIIQNDFEITIMRHISVSAIEAIHEIFKKLKIDPINSFDTTHKNGFES